MTAVLDRLVAGCGLVLSLPVLVLAAAGVKRASPGPVLHRAERAGRDGVPFTMYKLRTMHLGAASGGPITSSADARIFPLGRRLRRLKLDELPQLYNVVRGEMALVGPRPEDVEIVRTAYDELMWESLTVPPGMTSIGSLSYFEDEAKLPSDPAEAERMYLEEILPRKVALDLVYVRRRSVAYELEVLARTLLGVLGVHGAFAARVARERADAERILAERLSG